MSFSKTVELGEQASVVLWVTNTKLAEKSTVYKIT